jgi:putative hydrolase of the HAD superfamily
MRALLLDLDDTLVVEEPAAVAAFAATAACAAERHPVDPRQLALDARAGARALWHAAEVCAFGRRIGISSWEALWCRYEGDDDELRAMREWAPGFRRDAWRVALERQDVEDDELAAELGERFGEERRARHETFEDAVPALDALRGEYRLALVTNGASCLQREKFEASGLTDRFEAVVVSGELRSAKPDPAVYARALDALGARAAEAVMVGDSMRNDVDGPVAAGLRGIWLNRTGEARPADRDDVVEIADLHELPAALATLA